MWCKAQGCVVKVFPRENSKDSQRIPKGGQCRFPRYFPEENVMQAFTPQVETF